MLNLQAFSGLAEAGFEPTTFGLWG